MPITDGYKVVKGDPLREQHEGLDRLLRQYGPYIGGSFYTIKTDGLRGAKDILSADRETQSKTVDALIARLEPLENRFNDLYRRARAKNDYNVHMMKGWDAIRSPQSVLIELLRALLKRDLPLSADTMLRLLNWLSGSGAFNSHWYPIIGVIKNFEHFAKNNPVTPKLAKAATAFCNKLAEEIGESKSYKLRQRIERALETSPAVPSPAPAASRTSTMQSREIKTQSAQLVDAFNKAWARDRTCDMVALKRSPGAQAILQAEPEVRMSAIGHILELIGDFAQRGKKSGDPERWFSQKGFPWGSVYLARM